MKQKVCKLWLFLIFFINIIVCFYYAKVEIITRSEQSDLKDTEYKYSHNYHISLNIDNYDYIYNYGNDVLSIINQCSQNDIAIGIIDIPINFDEFGISLIGELCFGNRERKYNIVEGEYPNNNCIDKYVILGKNRRKYSFLKNGIRYIIINRELYEVKGFISGEKTRFYDNAILIFDNLSSSSLSQNINDYLFMDNIIICIESDDEVKIEKVCLEFEQMFAENSDKFLMEKIGREENVRWKPSHAPRQDYVNLAKIAFLFSLFANYWILQYYLILRKKEFFIKMIYGFTPIRLINSILFEIMILMLLGYLCGTGTMVFIIYKQNIVTGFDKYSFLYAIKIMLFAGIIILIGNVIFIFNFFKDKQKIITIKKGRV